MPRNYLRNKIEDMPDGPCSKQYKPYAIPELGPPVNDELAVFKTDMLVIVDFINKIAI